jgi:hypothetical protein
MMHADRTNRAFLTILCLLLLLGGAALIVAGTATNLYGAHFSRRHLLDNPAAQYAGTHSNWFWPAIAFLAFLLALLALRWLAAVLRPQPRTGDIDITAAVATGRTHLDSGALRDALTGEIETYRGVDNARVQVLGSSDAPRLAVTIRATRDANLAALRRRLETRALQHARQALDAPGLPIHLDLDVTKQPGSRVS